MIKKFIGVTIIMFALGYSFGDNYVDYGWHTLWITPLNILIFVVIIWLFSWLFK